MILVVGATGILGGTIARELLARGKEVRVLLRHNSPSEALVPLGLATSAQSLIDAGAQPVFGDLRDRGSLDAAVAGIQTVITTANSAMRGGEDNVENVDLNGNRSLVEAAAAAGVERFVFVSAFSADPESPVPFLRAKGQTELRLQSSGMDYAILAPHVFAEVWVGMVVGGPLQSGLPITLVGEGRRKKSFTSMQDVVAYAVAATEHPAARNRHIAIGGPQAMSWREVVATAEQVLGRELPVQFVALGDPVPGISEEVLPLLIGMEMEDVVIDMTETASTFGLEPTPLATVLGRMFASATGAS
jgi:uncharacterized protein YbjT (DUF2867 family)